MTHYFQSHKKFISTYYIISRSIASLRSIVIFLLTNHFAFLFGVMKKCVLLTAARIFDSLFTLVI